MNLMQNFGIRRAPILCIFLMLLRSQEITAGYATLTNNVYSNIVVAFSKDLDLGTGTPIVSASTIQNLFRDASLAIFKATGNRVYFGDITLIGPDGTIGDHTVQLRQPRATANQWQPPFPSFESADIRIDTPNDAYGDYPYTQQSRGCGEPGDFIHLTLGFVNGATSSAYDPAQRGKMLANEWIKYRYGVFDENGYSLDEFYPQMYYGTNGATLYNTCNDSPVTWDNANDICTSSSSIEGLSDSCTLIPDSTATENSLVTSSMMTAPSISLATKYCTDSSNHNVYAPNKQNYLCNGNSIMEIVLAHSDFDNDENQPIPDSSYKDLVVSSVVTKTKIALEIIVDPMEYAQTIYTVIPALQKFVVMEFPVYSYFGITENTDDFKDICSIAIMSNETKSRTARDAIIRIDSNNSTSITLGNLETTVANAIDNIMNVVDQNQYTKAVLLLSDNANSVQLTIICAYANSSGIQLHLVTYTPSVFQNFKDIKTCPGQVYLIQADVRSTGQEDLKSCYSDLQKRVQLQDVLRNLPSAILPDYFETPTLLFDQMYMQSTSNGTFYVDLPVVSGDVGFYVDTCLNGIYEIFPENLLNLTLGSTIVPYESMVSAFADVQTINAGLTYWNFTATTQTPQNVPYVVYAVGQPFTQSWSTIVKTPLVVKAEGWIVAETQDTWTKVRIFASVKNGTTPIFNAKVTAKIFAGNQVNYTVVLRDDGSGNPDISEKDGIYSSYFTQFINDEEGEEYSVTITITDNDGSANYPTTPYPSLNTNKNMDMGIVYTTPFQRTIEAGSFKATGSSSDIPPGTFKNFRVQSIIGNTVTFAWTAPGLQLDYGQVYQYLTNCDTDRETLANLTKLHEYSIPPKVPPPPPKSPGSLETHTFNGTYDQAVQYCAMQAIDKNGTETIYGEISNIISYYIISEPTTTSRPTTPSAAAQPLITIEIFGVIVGCTLIFFAIDRQPY